MVTVRIPYGSGRGPGPDGELTLRCLALGEIPTPRLSVESQPARDRSSRRSTLGLRGDKTRAQPEASARADRHPPPLTDGPIATEFSFILGNDPSLIPALVTWLRTATAQLGLFDDPTALGVDLALHEALMNGIQHGNLELDSRLRQEEEAVYRRLAEERRWRPPYRDRRLYVRGRLSRAEAVYIIRDEGHGFDSTTVPNPTNPAHLERASGRGLLLIRAFMDEVAFNGVGNQITLIKRRTTSSHANGS